MGFKGLLCWFFVSLILHEVYPQDSTSFAIFSKSELACQRYEHLRENFQKVNKTCLEEKLIGGTDSVINEFPHMVAIGYETDREGPPYLFQCSGFLISEKFVLTAAHCVNKRRIVPKIVRLGKTSMNDGKDCNDAIDVNVFSKHIHKNYNFYSKHNDIALLELEDNVDRYFSFSLFPACLHHGSKPLSDLTVSSWSREIASLNSHNSDDSSQDRTIWLQKVSMQEMTIENCRKSFKDLEVEVAEVSESQMCATSPTHPDIACQVLSGSPLQYKLNDTFYVAGFVSYGVACGANKPEVATRVGSFIDWIENIVWP